MAAPPWKIVQEVIQESDVILEILDARYPHETRNKDAEKLVKKAKKPLIYVLNKADMLRERFADLEVPLKPFVFVSATKNLGTTRLRGMLRKYIKTRPIVVGIIGYPNTGKSSLINVLKQRKSAPTSPIAGFTRGMQKIKIEKRIYMLDTPGVFAQLDYDKIKHALTGTVSIAQMRDQDLVAIEILDIMRESNPKVLKELYAVEWKDDVWEVLEDIALHYHFLLKGGKPDSMRAARKVIEDWQKGKILV